MKEKHPLNLPVGSVRAILALSITLVYLAGLLFSKLSSETLAALSSIEGMVLGYYFGTRQQTNLVSSNSENRSKSIDELNTDESNVKEFKKYTVEVPKPSFDIGEAESHLEPKNDEVDSNLNMKEFEKLRRDATNSK